jgi:DNA-binding transcriptional ArsR family regulator
MKSCAVPTAALTLDVEISARRRSDDALDSHKRSTGIQNLEPTDPLAEQLIEAAGLRDACDLDLLLFFSRHPRVVLSSEQLAAYVGYELPQVARALERLLGAGLLKRTLNQGAPGRMYVLEVDHVEAWLEPLRRVCATPDGRNALKALLKQRQSENGEGSYRRLFRVRPS